MVLLSAYLWLHGGGVVGHDGLRGRLEEGGQTVHPAGHGDGLEGRVGHRHSLGRRLGIHLVKSVVKRVWEDCIRKIRRNSPFGNRTSLF